MQTELDTLAEVARVPGDPSDRPSPIQPSRTTSPRISLSQAAIRTSAPSITNLMRMALENPGIVSLAAGFVDQQTLPVDVASRAIDGLMADPVEGRRSLQYGTTIGRPELRERLVARLEASQGVSPGTYREAIGRTVVTTGSAQLIYLVCEALLDPGDIVLVESPTYFVFLGPVETRGARAIRVPIDEGGMQIDALDAAFARIQAEGQLDRVKLIYSIPEHANPTGISLAAERRKPLVDLVKRWSATAGRRIFLLEDAAYHGLSYGQTEPSSLWSHDPDRETVILARTFSKTFSPGVKIGYGILPKGLVEPILRLKGNHDFGSANLNQQLLERVLTSGDYDRHVEHLRALYGRKRDIFLEALDATMKKFGGDVHWTQPHGGLFVWMTLPEGVDTSFEGTFFANCLKQGVLYVPGEYAFAPEPGPVPRNHMRLSFGVPGEPELIEGARRLSAALEASLSPTRAT